MHADAPKLTLAQRIAEDPAAEPAVLEAPHDLLWYAELADALAPCHGHETARVRHEHLRPELDYDRAEEPNRPRADAVPLAAAEVAQLVAFGATPPPRCGSWQELVDGVVADVAVAEATVGRFPLPAEMSAVDGQVVPGTGLVVEVGRDPRQLAEWSGYMGNCIGQSWYAAQAERGQCVLMALRDESGRIAANLDIRRRAAGWEINELRARFNDTVDPALEAHVRRWVGTLAPREQPAPVVPGPRVRARHGSARRTTTRLPADLVSALTTEVARTLAAAGPARRTYAALARNFGPQADFEPAAAVIALKRLGPAQHTALLRTALTAGVSAAAVWRATGVRPLATAVGDLPSEQRARLTTLTEDAPLAKTMRALVRRPEIAPAHAMDVVARAIRRALGSLLDDEALTRSVARRPSPTLLCALTIATTCAEPSLVDTVRVAEPGTTAVPGFPATDLLDERGPWQHAIPGAADLGAPVARFATRVAEHGLLVPSALLGKGGWPALWRRAHR